MAEKFDISSLSPRQKAAILLILLGPDASAGVIQKLDRELSEDLVREVSRLRTVSPEVGKAVLEEFRNVLNGIYGGKTYATRLIEKSFGIKGEEFFGEEAEAAIEAKSVSELLGGKSTEEIIGILKEEHPQVIAIVLTSLPPEKGSEVLKEFSIDAQIDIMRRMGTLKGIPHQVLDITKEHIKSKVQASASMKFGGDTGLSKAANIIALTDMERRRQIMDSLRDKSPDLAESIRQLLFTFEDIMRLEDRAVQKIVAQIDIKDLALALKGADEEIKNKFIKNMSERAGEMLREEMELMGPVRVSQVDEQQRKIADIVMQLEDKGEIIIPGRGERIIV